MASDEPAPEQEESPQQVTASGGLRLPRLGGGVPQQDKETGDAPES